jgi:O-antigen/teichoic acid export membrane protein
MTLSTGSWISSIFREGKWFAIAGFLAKLVGFLLLPIYLKYLSPEEYGVFTNLDQISQFVAILMTLNTDKAIYRFVHHDRLNMEYQRRLLSSTVLFTLVIGILVFILVYMSSYVWMDKYMGVSVYPYSFVFLTSALTFSLASIGMAYIKTNLKSKRASTYTLIHNTLGFSVGLPLVVILGWSSLGRLIGPMTANIALLVLVLAYLKKNRLLSFEFDGQLLRQQLKFSIPLVFTSAASLITLLADKLLITTLVDVGSSGIYSVGTNLAIPLYLIMDSITNVLAPMSQDGLNTAPKRTGEKLALSLRALFVILSTVNIALFLFSKDIILYFIQKEEYLASFFVLPIIGSTYLLMGQYRVFTAVINYFKKNWIIFWGSIFMAFINVILNIIFIPKFGYVYASLATAISFFAYYVWLAYQSQKLFKLPIKWTNYVVSWLVFAFGLVVIFLLDAHHWHGWGDLWKQIVFMLIFSAIMLQTIGIKKIVGMLRKQF